nr:translation initiation factor 1 [Telfairia occidentalis]UYF13124.1 translation initiation factor 1 [Telfairia occidentalis]
MYTYTRSYRVKIAVSC